MNDVVAIPHLKMLRRYCVMVLGLVCFLLVPRSMHGQTYLDYVGIPNFTTQVPVQNGFINISNGNLHLEIGLPEPKQRGNVALNPKFIYDSRIWQIQGAYSWQPSEDFGGDPNALNLVAGGWRFSDAFGGDAYSIYRTTACQSSNPGLYPNPVGYDSWGPWYWIDPSGTSHEFGAVTIKEDPNAPTECKPGSLDETTSSSSDADAQDGSGYHLYVTNYTSPKVLDKDGNQVCCGEILDTNGNAIVQNAPAVGIVDTRGLKPLLFSNNGGNQYYIDVLGAGGTYNRYTVTTETINVKTNFQQEDVTEYSGTLTVIQEIQLPDGSSYQFQYDSGTTAGHYGEVTQVTLPTGGVVHYGYSVYNDSYQNANHWLTSWTTSDGVWTFTPGVITQCAENGTGCQEKVTVTPPTAPSPSKSGDIVYTLTLNGGSWNTQVDRWSGSSTGGGTLLLSTQTAYTYNQPDGPVDQFVTKEVATTILQDVGKQVQTEYDFDSATGSTLTALKQHDFTACSNGLPLQETDYTYDTSSGFTAAHILDKPSQVTTLSCGSQVSQTTYDYDEGTLTTTTAVPAPAPVSGSRGNLTSGHQWINTSGATFDTAATYDTAGIQLTSTDPNGQSASSHDATGAYTTRITPPTPSSGVSLPQSATYDASTGLPLTATDPNGAERKYVGYDWDGRPTEVDNLDSGGNTVGQTTIIYRNPNQTGTFPHQSASLSSETETLLDGYGRKSRVAEINGGSWYQTDDCYDADGRLRFQPYQYQGTGWGTPQVCSGAGDTYSYDALGRVTEVLHGDGSYATYQYTGRATKVTDEAGVTRISQVDGLGRTTAVCEISSNGSMPGSSGSPVSCGMDIAGTGFLTTYAYCLSNHTTTVTQGGQTRIFQTDSLGRTVSVQEPESGTATYSYAYNSTGLAVTRTRPKANQPSSSVHTTTITQYDKVGRPISVTYSDGTPTKSYNYDTAAGSAWTNGSSALNLKGRLAYMNADTSTADTGSLYSYNAMGRVIGLWECTPFTCNTSARTTRGLTYSYDWVGNQLSATDGAGATTSYTYSQPDQLTSVTSSLNDAQHPPALVSSVQNGPFGPTSYVLGNGLGGALSYDSLGRRNGGWLCAGSTAPYCTGGTQKYGYSLSTKGSRVTNACDTVLGKCETYGYDEFNRLTSLTVNSGVTQNFSYGYDRWGNRWSQSVTAGSGPTWSASYNTANNQVTGYTYDAAGNATSDGTHTYTYDAEGNITQVDGGSTAVYTYNALNQRVRISQGSASQEFIFNMSGQRASVWDGGSGNLIEGMAFWGTAPIEFYSGGAAHFQHQDWAGTERMRTTYSGAVEGSFTSLSFGDGYGYTGSDNDSYHFAGLDMDSGSGTDHAPYRQYSSAAGSWLSPDPYSGSYDFSNPQSLNRYAYVVNNPLTLNDPSGLSATQPVPCGEDASGPIFCMSDSTDGGDGSFLPGVLGDIIEAVVGVAELGKVLGWWDQPQFKGSLEPRPQAPNNGPCSSALSAANRTPGGVARANAAWSVLQSAASAHNIPTALLAAIGVRETDFMNVQEYGGGPGMGVFQLTNQQGVTAAQAFNVPFAANYAANMLSTNMTYLSNAFSFTPSQLTQATAASYNFGLGNISGNPSTIDVGTTGGNYGSTVVNLMGCFSHP